MVINILELKNKVRVILYGTGNTSIPIMKKLLRLSSIQIVAVVDGNPDKSGQDFFGYKIINPIDIHQYEYDYMIIASVFKDQIIEQLMKLGISMSKVLDDYIYFIQRYWVKERYQQYYSQHKKISKYHVGKNEKIVIYTSMFGNYDRLHDPLFIDPNCDYICFTDNHELKSDIWKIFYIKEGYHQDPNRAAKIYKILPHQFLNQYEWSIWVDANITIIGDLRELINKSVGASGMANLIHVDRDCIYEEAETCINMKKDKEEVILKQIERYQQEGYPHNNGLICGSCIIRRHNEPVIIQLMERWWSEIQAGSRRDQLSFNYSAWKENFYYDVMDIHTFVNPYIRTSNHLM